MTTEIKRRKEIIDGHFDKLNSVMNLVVGAANTIAGKAVIDAKNELYKRKDLWRHEIKLNARLAEKAYYDYERVHTQNLDGGYNLFLDYMSAVEDNMAKDVDMLMYSIAQVLTKHNQSDAMLKARVETARTLSEFSCGVFDKLIEEANKKVNSDRALFAPSGRLRKPFDFLPYFSRGRLTTMFHYWDKVTAKICRVEKGGGTIILNDDPNCKLAFEIIERKLTSEDFLNKASYEALKLNPDCIRQAVTEDVFRELEEKFGNDN